MRQMLKIRRRLLMKYGFTCYWCGKEVKESGKREVKATVDHLVPVSKGGTHAEHNLVIACEPCNNLKADKNIPISNPIKK